LSTPEKNTSIAAAGRRFGEAHSTTANPVESEDNVVGIVVNESVDSLVIVDAASSEAAT